MSGGGNNPRNNNTSGTNDRRLAGHRHQQEDPDDFGDQVGKQRNNDMINRSNDFLRSQQQNVNNFDPQVRQSVKSDRQRQYEQNLKQYEKNQVEYTQNGVTQQSQLFLRRISANSRIPKEVRELRDQTLLTHLNNVSKTLMFNEMEIVVWALYLDKLGWTDEKFSLEDNLYLTAFAVKMYLNSDHQMFQTFLNCKKPNFSANFNSWLQRKDRKTMSIPPRELNAKFKVLNRPVNVNSETKLIDYNFSVDEILSNAPAYTPGPNGTTTNLKGSQTPNMTSRRVEANRRAKTPTFSKPGVPSSGNNGGDLKPGKTKAAGAGKGNTRAPLDLDIKTDSNDKMRMQARTGYGNNPGNTNTTNPDKNNGKNDLDEDLEKREAMYQDLLGGSSEDTRFPRSNTGDSKLGGLFSDPPEKDRLFNDPVVMRQDSIGLGNQKGDFDPMTSMAYEDEDILQGNNSIMGDRFSRTGANIYSADSFRPGLSRGYSVLSTNSDGGKNNGLYREDSLFGSRAQDFMGTPDDVAKRSGEGNGNGTHLERNNTPTIGMATGGQDAVREDRFHSAHGHDVVEDDEPVLRPRESSFISSLLQ